MKRFIGKRVRVILVMGSTTIPLEGVIKKVNKEWVEIKIDKKKRLINKDIIAYIEEIA
jgi:RNase P/RNase MRP subunit p29